MSPEKRRHRVEEAAYYRAERRGFIGGNPADDWMAAEEEVAAQLGDKWIRRRPRPPAKDLWEKTVEISQQCANNRRVSRNTPRLRIRRILAIAVVLILGISVLITLPFQWLNPPTTSFMLQSGQLHINEWIPLEQISPNMVVAAVAAEDQKFPNHFGLDFESIFQALHEKRKRPRGASTISQQVVKNLYLWPDRRLVRKGLEAYLTIFVEAFWTKHRILEVYLNIAEFGPDLYGVGAASSAFFGKAPRALTLHEASLLAAILPNPRRYSVVNPSSHVRKRASWIRRQARQLGGAAYLESL